MDEVGQDRGEVSGLTTVRCPRCDAAQEVAESSDAFECASCRGYWTFRQCGSCQLVLTTRSAATQFTCPWCGIQTKLPLFKRDPTISVAAVVQEQLANLGVNYERGDLLIAGLTVVGGYGWAPPAGTKVTVGVCSDHLAVAPVPFSPPPIELSYERLQEFDFQGGAAGQGATFFGGGFGLVGAAAGIIVASVLNSLTAKTEVNSVVRISATDGELYLHRGGVLPDKLRTLFAPAVNAVRGSHTYSEPRQLDPVERLERLGRLREAGTLTEAEFEAAKGKILDELT